MDEEKERKPDKVIKIKVPKFTKKFRENPWIVSTFVLIVLAIVLVVNGSGGITGGVISEDDAGDIVLDLAKSQVRDAEVIEINSKNGLYEVVLLMDGEEVLIYITKDGKNLVQGITPISLFTSEPQQQESEEEVEKNPEMLVECVELYGLTQDTIIFYHSNQCGWCTKMKPAVENLEKEGYKFYWAETSDEEASELIDNCVRSYMGSSGVPQFICVKTGEMHVGAFVDEDKNLDQSALQSWIDSCIAS